MQINGNFSEIIKKLPHGSQKLISEETGVSQKTVSNFFNGKRVNITTHEVLNEAVLKLRKQLSI